MHYRAACFNDVSLNICCGRVKLFIQGTTIWTADSVIPPSSFHPKRNRTTIEQRNGIKSSFIPWCFFNSCSACEGKKCYPKKAKKNEVEKQTTKVSIVRTYQKHLTWEHFTPSITWHTVNDFGKWFFKRGNVINPRVMMTALKKGRKTSEQNPTLETCPTAFFGVLYHLISYNE